MVTSAEPHAVNNSDAAHNALASVAVEIDNLEKERWSWRFVPPAVGGGVRVAGGQVAGGEGTVGRNWSFARKRWEAFKKPGYEPHGSALRSAARAETRERIDPNPGETRPMSRPGRPHESTTGERNRLPNGSFSYHTTYNNIHSTDRSSWIEARSIPIVGSQPRPGSLRGNAEQYAGRPWLHHSSCVVRVRRVAVLRCWLP